MEFRFEDGRAQESAVERGGPSFLGEQQAAFMYDAYELEPEDALSPNDNLNYPYFPSSGFEAIGEWAEYSDSGSTVSSETSTQFFFTDKSSDSSSSSRVQSGPPSIPRHPLMFSEPGGRHSSSDPLSSRALSEPFASANVSRGQFRSTPLLPHLPATWTSQILPFHSIHSSAPSLHQESQSGFAFEGNPGFHGCPYPGCFCKYKNRRSLLSHIRKKHNPTFEPSEKKF